MRSSIESGGDYEFEKENLKEGESDLIKKSGQKKEKIRHSAQEIIDEEVKKEIEKRGGIRTFDDLAESAEITKEVTERLRKEGKIIRSFDDLANQKGGIETFDDIARQK